MVLKYNLYDNQIIATLKKVILVYDLKAKKITKLSTNCNLSHFLCYICR